MSLEALLSKQPDYVDLDLDFFANPTTLDVYKKTGEEAIKRSVRNIIFTNFYEKPFQPNFGSGVWDLLFEPATPFTVQLMNQIITSTIENFEPRVKLESVDVSVDNDNNGFNVQLKYLILNKKLPVTTSLFLERIR